MRSKLIIYLSVFSALILAAMWLLNIVFLDDIYSAIKNRQILAAADKITEHAASEDLETAVYDIADKGQLCVSVFEIDKGRGKMIASAHVHSVCRIHGGAGHEEYMGRLYGGTMVEGDIYDIKEGESESLPDSVVFARSRSIDKLEYLIVINAEVQPVTATVTTLTYLFVWMTVLVAALSVIMAYIISRSITKPVVKMNREARKLAVGNYDVSFSGGGYREASELAGTLDYAAGELSRMDAMQKELIANISHDLRTPLTTIMGFSEVMRDIPGENTPENMQVVIDETKRLSELVSDMLDVSRITAGTRQVEMSEFSLSDVISETLLRYNTLRERDGYVFHFTKNADAVVLADKTLILQVVYNLINNAVNYCGEDKSVWVDLKVENGIARVSVSDRGEGIESEKLPLIWDRYYKAGDFHKRAVCGTGLGLSIVKNALILHGADFGVSSTVGRGSTFWFELKLSSPNA